MIPEFAILLFFFFNRFEPWRFEHRQGSGALTTSIIPLRRIRYFFFPWFELEVLIARYIYSYKFLLVPLRIHECLMFLFLSICSFLLFSFFFFVYMFICERMVGHADIAEVVERDFDCVFWFTMILFRDGFRGTGQSPWI